MSENKVYVVEFELPTLPIESECSEPAELNARICIRIEIPFSKSVAKILLFLDSARARIDIFRKSFKGMLLLILKHTMPYNYSNFEDFPSSVYFIFAYKYPRDFPFPIKSSTFAAQKNICTHCLNLRK